MSLSSVQSLAGTPIAHAVDQWSGYCQRYSPSTRYAYAKTIERALRYCHFRVIRDIRAVELAAYINSRLAQVKTQSVNNELIALRSFGRWLADIYDVPNPALKLRKFPPNDPHSRFLTPEEYHKLVTATDDRTLGLIKFLCNTGLRSCELIRLSRADVQGQWLSVLGKGRKRRTIPLNATALQTLHYAVNFTKSHTMLFKIFRRAARRAGIAPFGPHACRHYFATRLLAKGVPIHHVSKLLGHSSVVITEQIYYHFRPDHLAGLTDCLEE